MRCIWCLEEKKASIEHLLPAALGCPDWLTSATEVCADCNSALSSLDNSCKKYFEVAAFSLGMKGRNGSPTSVANSRHLRTKEVGNEKILQINAGPGEIQIGNNQKLKQPSKTEKPKITFFDDRVKINFQIKLDFDKKFCRFLHKSALTSYAIEESRKKIICNYDSIRNYVKNGLGGRSFYLTKMPFEKHNIAIFGISRPLRNEKLESVFFNIFLFGIMFTVYLGDEKEWHKKIMPGFANQNLEFRLYTF